MWYAYLVEGLTSEQEADFYTELLAPVFDAEIEREAEFRQAIGAKTQ